MTVAESHSKGEQRHSPLSLADTGGRSAMARASDTRPFKPYVYRGGEKEPAAVTAARDRHLALSAAMALRDALIMPDPDTPWEFYRELHDAPVPAALTRPPVAQPGRAQDHLRTARWHAAHNACRPRTNQQERIS